ncbi:MAG: bis(5'-nucleosyl)-tetraphosphatase (symmetrical) YqeK [Candidatus Atribacteria bacterium]|nr:bis(5'-nucleosyl)-tetraphosphatase (symmetrical) YqeK [Candidatus Atribacteria bacterium]MBE3092862.1 bis(5'-nucleosyl)-tetraphosphatase (symmetrical) YqeK [Chloroflexota bacterium]MBE3127264.1 bis(5'-nucleosyl)-tetraphosphatase (symmetrical) YqeK [Candidatus Atribacteria bacterium]
MRVDIDLIKLKLKEMLGEERLEHSVNTSKIARKLAMKYDYDTDKAEVAGLLHDCAKDLDYKTLKKMVLKYNIELDEMVQKIPKLLHPLVGVVIAKKEFNIQDPVILKAIKTHSTGSAQMSLLDKIIYLSDKIEPLRNMNGVEEVRKMAEIDLDRAALMALDKGLLYLISKNLFIHPISIEARNNILSKVVFV